MKKDRILEDLKDRIVNGFYRPGDSLNERLLCEQYTVSRTPIREVLWALVSDGVFDHTPSKGFSVKKFTSSQIFDVYQTLEAVEGMAARLACQNADEALIGRLKSIRTELETKDGEKDTERCVTLGREVHTELMKATRNEVLQQVYSNLIVKTRLVVHLMESRTILEEESRSYHLKIIEAVLARDCEASETIMRHHLRKSCRNIVKVLFPDVARILDAETSKV